MLPECDKLRQGSALKLRSTAATVLPPLRMTRATRAMNRLIWHVI